MSQDAAAPAAPAPAEAPVIEEGHKVFVGNLSFQTKKDELATHFSKVGPVLKADIITRNVRSLGYGFVAYETLAQAEEAVTRFNKTELGGRTINVEVAKPKVEHPPKEKKKKSKKPKKAETASVESDDNQDTTTDIPAVDSDAVEGDKEKSEASADEGKKKGKRYGRRFNRRPRFKAEAKESEEAATVNGESTAADSEGDKEVPNKKRGRRSKGAAHTNGEQHFTRERAPRTQGPPSKTTVFVANLPFTMVDDGLKELFKDFKVVSARVVRRYGSGRSKGYGFVELADEAEQQNVLNKMKNVVADGRELSIGVAHSEAGMEDATKDEATDASA